MATMRAEELSLGGALWVRDACDEDVLGALEAAGFGSNLARCLALVGIVDADMARAFLKPKLGDLCDPYLMKGMARAESRLREAIDGGQRIRVVTDYDVDGTTSSLILQSVLEILGHREFSYHIPHRMIEGYGFSVHAAKRAVEDGVQVIVTADIGVRDHEAIAYAQEHGVDVIVLDHHLPQGQGVPEEAYVVLCPPQEGCGYPNPGLAACGISLKLAQAMLREHPKYEIILRSLMKLAALGTVADVVTLRSAENRAIVALGVEQLNAGPHKAGLQALLDISKVKIGEISSEDIGYRIGPRINAAGRLSSATSIVELLRCSERKVAVQMAQGIDNLNVERQDVQGRMLDRAVRSLPEELPDFVCVAYEEDEEWHRGVLGIVAGRLREVVNRPVALACVAGGHAIGSIRSTAAVHAVSALEQARALLLRFGGHAAAAGFTLEYSAWGEFCERMRLAAKIQTGGEQMLPTQHIGLEMSLEQVNDDFWRVLSQLQPFGKDNPEPLLCLRGVVLNKTSIIQGKHLRGQFLGQGANLSWIWFNSAEHFSECRDACVDVLANLRRDTWHGRGGYQLLVKDMRLCAERGGAR